MFSSQFCRIKARRSHGAGVSRYSRIESLEARRVLAGAALPMLAGGEGEGTAMPDFALVDRNSTSPTYEQPVSPRDYLEQVSAWYFGEAS